MRVSWIAQLPHDINLHNFMVFTVNTLILLLLNNFFKNIKLTCASAPAHERKENSFVFAAAAAHSF